MLGERRDGAACVSEKRRGVRQIDFRVAGFLQRQFLGDDALRQGDGRRQRIAIRRRVEQTRLRQIAGRHGLAAHDHVERALRTHQARQPLRTARARQKPQLDLGHSERCRRGRDPVVARHAKFQSTAQCQSADRRHHRFGRRLDQQQQVCQGRGRRHGGQTEFADVGAAAKRGCGSGNHHRSDRRIVRCAFDSVRDRSPQAHAQGIDGRIF